MNENIHVLRQAVAVVTQALTDSNVRVTQEGLKAFVENDRSGKPIRINLPFLPDNATDELIAAVQGFLDHEVAHVLFTDFSVKSRQPELQSLINMLEDARVEKLMAKKYRGSGSNLEDTGNFYLKELVEPNYREKVSKGAEEEVTATLMPALLRALSGQELYQHYLKDKMPHVQKLHDLLEPLAPKLESLSSTKEVADMAKTIYKILNDVEDEPPSEDENDDSSDEKGGGEGKDDKSEKPSKGAGSAATSESEDEEKDKGESADGAADKANDEDGEGEGGSGSSEEGDKGKSEADAVKWQKGDDKDREIDLSKKHAAAILDSLKDELNGFGESVSTKIAEGAAEAAKKAQYNVFTTEGDVIEKMTVPERNYSEKMFKRIEDKTMSMVGPMQKDLERAISARSKSVWENGLRKGKLNSGSLARLAATRDDRVFRQRQDSQTKDVAVSLVIDASGSMSGSKIHTAATSAYALSAVLDRLKIAHEVICFTTSQRSEDHYNRRKQIREAEEKYGIEYSRSENLYMPIIKGFDERISTETKKRFGWLPNSGMLANNVDGECVEIAARRLLARKETGKIMMVLSDGHPSANGDHNALNWHLKDVVKSIEKAKVNIIGIGIESSAVRQFYSKHVVINNESELPSLVISRLKGMLLN